MKRNIFALLLCFALILISEATEAQTRYLVKFKHKGSSPFSISNPGTFLSQRSIDRRIRYQIPVDSTDLPITPRFLDSLRSIPGVSILNASKWLNQVSILVADVAAIDEINKFSFVQPAVPIAARTLQAAPSKFADTSSLHTAQRVNQMAADYFTYGMSYAQVHLHNGEFLHNIGLRGQNMIIGMLDAGYLNYLSVKSFDSVRANGQVLGTWDFVAGNSSVNEDHPHGMQCFSIIAANVPGQFIGTAPKASFYLFRTEEAATEYPIEEHNWVCGAERVDSAGGDLISSSLGYYSFDAPLQAYSHTYADMNGNTTMAAIGADLAAKKGILVVNAAGNEGANPWHYIITPADGDSVLAVGAVTTTGVVGGFSSFGPSSDGQVKPDVASVGVGTTVQYANNVISTGNGTSFACPNMAGLATCLWQGFQEVNNMRIIQVLRQSAHKYNAPDDRVGYGIPDVKKATMLLLKELATASASVSVCNASINWTSKDMRAMRYDIERKVQGEMDFVKVGEQSGTGNLFSTHSYQYLDDLANVPAGPISYRIRQVIDTSAAGFTAAYLDTVTVTHTIICTNTDNEIVLIPNPARNHVNIKLTTKDAIDALEVRVSNALGQQVLKLSKSKPAGAVIFPLPIQQLAKGKYFVSLYRNGRLIGTQELLKL